MPVLSRAVFRCSLLAELWITEIKMASSSISKLDSKVAWSDESTKALIREESIDKNRLQSGNFLSIDNGNW